MCECVNVCACVYRVWGCVCIVCVCVCVFVCIIFRNHLRDYHPL